MGDGGYKPYDNRNMEKPLSNCEAFMTLLKCVIGTGILSMPLAFKYSGTVGGVVMTILCTALVIYGMQLLIKCMVESSRRNKVGYMNFPDTMVFSFSVGPKCCRYISEGVGCLVDIILCIAHYGYNVVYHVFVAIHFKELSDIYITSSDLRVVCAIVGLLCLPLFLVRQLKYLVPFSIIANVLIYLSLCAICYYMIKGLPSLGEKRMLPLNALDVPIFVGIVMFATSSVGVMLAVEAKMAKPALYLGWHGILSLCALFVCITNIIFGFLGYWRYGDNIAASVTINLPAQDMSTCGVEICLLYHDSYGRLRWKLFKNILMIIFGTFVLCYGSYGAIRDMIQDYSCK
ncbi:glutamate transporter polyphemus isoform X4 [Drosophila virilis]|uniref:glutamate transporter polyphemus isoform X4 n=1 Tax=Drosophila virilis TaxID=7244 RepID=UPI0013965312|nr:glutamate transporter polyphemus isoform X4 [Drosophila virilis]